MMIFLFKVTRKASELLWLLDIKNKHKNLKYLNKERISNSDDEQEIGQVIEDKGGQEEGDQEEDQEEDQEGDQEGQEGRENEEMNEDGGGVDYYYSSEEERRLFESEGMKKYKKN